MPSSRAARTATRTTRTTRGDTRATRSASTPVTPPAEEVRRSKFSEGRNTLRREAAKYRKELLPFLFLSLPLFRFTVSLCRCWHQQDHVDHHALDTQRVVCCKAHTLNCRIICFSLVRGTGADSNGHSEQCAATAAAEVRLTRPPLCP